MPPKPPTKTSTQPGLGEGGPDALSRMDSTEMRRVRDSFRRDDGVRPGAETSSAATPAPAAARPRLRDSVRREDPDDDEPAPNATHVPNAAPSRPRSSWQPEVGTGTRKKDGETRSRPPVTVDQVGAAAVKIARTTRRDSAPKLIASRQIIAKAPIDTRSAFVMSLVDGRNTVESLIDMAGMPEAEVRAILDRLARLGLISLP